MLPISFRDISVLTILRESVRVQLDSTKFTASKLLVKVYSLVASFVRSLCAQRSNFASHCIEISSRPCGEERASSVERFISRNYSSTPFAIVLFIRELFRRGKLHYKLTNYTLHVLLWTYGGIWRALIIYTYTSYSQFKHTSCAYPYFTRNAPRRTLLLYLRIHVHFHYSIIVLSS